MRWSLLARSDLQSRSSSLTMHKVICHDTRLQYSLTCIKRKAANTYRTRIAFAFRVCKATWDFWVYSYYGYVQGRPALQRMAHWGEKDRLLHWEILLSHDAHTVYRTFLIDMADWLVLSVIVQLLVLWQLWIVERDHEDIPLLSLWNKYHTLFIHPLIAWPGVVARHVGVSISWRNCLFVMAHFLHPLPEHVIVGSFSCALSTFKLLVYDKIMLIFLGRWWWWWWCSW